MVLTQSMSRYYVVCYARDIAMWYCIFQRKLMDKRTSPHCNSNWRSKIFRAERNPAQWCPATTAPSWSTFSRVTSFEIVSFERIDMRGNHSNWNNNVYLESIQRTPKTRRNSRYDALVAIVKQTQYDITWRSASNVKHIRSPTCVPKWSVTILYEPSKIYCVTVLSF